MYFIVFCVTFTISSWIFACIAQAIKYHNDNKPYKAVATLIWTILWVPIAINAAYQTLMPAYQALITLNCTK